MDKFDIKTDTGKVENIFNFGKLSCDKKNAEELSFCQAKNAEMQDI
jgi:hypothetical protein